MESALGLTTRRWKNAPKGLYSVNLHRVGDPSQSMLDSNVFSCSEEQLEEHLRFFKSNFTVVNQDDLVTLFKQPEKVKQDRYLAITFDDGYIDNYSLALPMLKRHGLSATFFIATGLVGNQVLPWWDKVAYLLKSSGASSIKIAGWESTIESKGNQQLFVRMVLKQFKSCPLSADEQIRQMEEKLNFTAQYPTPEFMTWDNVKTLHESGMDIGAHSHNHFILTKLTDEEILFELQHSKALLEDHLKIPIKAFSYPIGNQSTYNQSVIETLKSTGYEFAFNFLPGININLEDKRYDLHRFPIETNMNKTNLMQMLAYAQVY